MASQREIWPAVQWIPRAASKALLEPQYFPICATALFLLELAAVPAIILLVPYTEIDWVAYMQEVEGFLNGTWDYTQLRGDTGPLVYPAGFVYLYSGLYYLTSHGQSLRLAQVVFAGLYLLNLGLVLSLYCKLAKPLQLPPYILAFLGCTAYRIHSIFLLRLFNDPLAMLLLYAAVYLFIHDRWSLGCFVYSLAVSVKMNILLFSPGLLVLLVLGQGWEGTLPRLGICAAVQLVLGLPFLLTNPGGYVIRAFDFGRQFLFQWTVNWRFLPEWLFLHRGFHLLLLVCQLSALFAFTLGHWMRHFRIASLMSWKRRKSSYQLRPEDIVWVLFTSNFVGVCFSRSLHYQFYVWYFHTLPLLLCSTRLHAALRVAVLLAIEYCWNVYPSTPASSLLLHACHAVTLAALFLLRTEPEKAHAQ